MNLTPLGPVPGVRDLSSLIAFLEDVKGFKKRLAEMEKQRDELNKLIATAGKVGEIDGILARARAAETTAEGKVRNAEEAAQIIVEDATTEIEKDKEALARRTAGQKARENDVARKLAIVEKRELAISDQVSAIGVRERRCAEREAAAAKSRDEYEAKLARIKAAAGA